MIETRLLGPTDSHYLNNVAADVFDDPIVESSVQQFFSDARHRLVVALDNDVVVGFVSAVIYLHPDKSAPELWINEIGVAPTHQRQGTGKALMQVLLDHAKRSGCSEAWVLTERANIAAMAMYKSAGGVETLPDPTMFTFKL
ncbi:MAG TPA: GNAT family N-acetyltransferase [Anaerolineales bacterium]|nr:GNAT family N-acetyltransferase [Anaerolineales bacterium]